MMVMMVTTVVMMTMTITPVSACGRPLLAAGDGDDGDDGGDGDE